MRNAPAPADESADQHGYSNRQTDEMPDAEKRKRKKEIEPTHGAAAPNPKCSSDVRREKLRGNDHRKDRGDNRSPENGEQARATMFNFRRVLGTTAAANFQHFSASDTLRIRQVGLGNQRAAQRNRIHHS